MPDPIWVDTNSLLDIIRGDKILEAELVGIRDREGRKLLITPKTWDELRNGNVLTQDPQIPQDSQIPNDSARNRVQGLKDRLKFDVDMEGKKLGKYKYMYTDPSEAHLKPEDRKQRIDIGQMRRIDDNLRLLDNVSESDSLVLSEVKAGAEVRGIKKPVIFTADRGMTVNARTLGIRPRNPTPRTQAPPPFIPGARVVNIRSSVQIASAWKATIIVGAIGGAIGGALITFGAYLLQEEQNKVNKKRIADGFKSLGAEIQRYVAARTRVVLDEAASKFPDGKVYVVAVVEVSSNHVNNPGWGQTAGLVPPTPEAVDSVKLHNIYISSEKKEGGAGETHPFGFFVQETDRYQYISAEVTPPKVLILDYNYLRSTVSTYKGLLKNLKRDAFDRFDIEQFVSRLEEQMEQLGTVDNFSPDPALWTDDGLRQISG